jgi:hypothetical protein
VSPFGISLPPELFSAGGEDDLTLSLGAYIVDLIRGETVLGDRVPTTLALLSLFEPLSLQYVSFEGPDSENPPVLRLILTVGEGVNLR